MPSEWVGFRITPRASRKNPALDMAEQGAAEE
jgi:hypothetical protein